MRAYYTGIGSRETPKDVLEFMEKIGKSYSQAGWVLRSGGAQGADLAFQAGAGTACEVYRPEIVKEVSQETLEKAVKIASTLHPHWSTLKDYVRKLHVRNVFQVLGRDLNTPSSVVLCWTWDRCTGHETRTQATGGTGMAISVASLADIPVLNLSIPEHYWKASLIIG